jgi:DNA-binding FadR family transcriptional regulator
MEQMESVDMKTRGRKPKNQKKEFVVNQEQTKFFVDLSSDKDSLDLIFGLLGKCNDKDYGREILFKDVCLYAASKLTDKDIEKLQEGSLSEMEKVQRALDEHNKKTGSNLTLGEFLVKKLGIN